MSEIKISINKHVKRVFSKLGYDIRRAKPNIKDFLQSRNVETFLDVGANVGQTGLRLREIGYTGKIVSFEPVQSAFKILKDISDRDGNWTAHNFALGAERMTAKINVSENTVFTSLLDQTVEACRFDPAAQVKHEETINIKPLDDLYDEFVDHKVFLKIVTQGFEQNVLAGAKNALKKVVGVELILPLVQIYKENWSFPQALTYMEDNGFTLAQIDQEIYGKIDPAVLLELYCVFARKM
jgi:FkbM family methyltransferase